MASTNVRVFSANTQVPPVATELEAIFKELPDEVLLSTLKGPRRRGRPGYEPEKLWRSFVAYYCLGLDSVSALIRLLYDNPFVAQTCGFDSPDDIPSQSTFSRFGTKLAKSRIALLVKNILRNLTRRLYDTLPGFGKSVAIDSTDIKAWSNGGKKGKNKKVSDLDAGWIVKQNTEGNKKYVWGFKVHILADAIYELPMVVDVTAGNVADVKRAGPLLRQARFTTSKFHPDYVIADAGYSSDALRSHIKRQYRAEPIIDPNPSHKKAFAKTVKTPEWKAIYNRRVAIERVNGRLKEHRRLNALRGRGKFKVRIHAFLSTIVCQAQALATGSLMSVRKVA